MTRCTSKRRSRVPRGQGLPRRGDRRQAGDERLWWELRAPRFELFVSPFVWDEAALGDAELAGRRCELLTGLHVLAVDEETTRIADALLASGAIPAKAATDASHIAVAIRHGMDFPLTWNCAHIANAQTLPSLRAVAASWGTNCPRSAHPTN